MTETEQSSVSMTSRLASPLVCGLLCVAAITAFSTWFLVTESEYVVGFLLVFALLCAVAAARWGAFEQVGRAFELHEKLMYAAVIGAVLVVAVIFREHSYTLLMITTVMIYLLAGLGLNIQFGYVGLINLAGASFLGVGAYTAAVLTMHTATPPLLILLIGGITSALAGFLLVVPMVRTRGHYSAVVTIAFAILLESFLRVNDILGGAQGLPSAPMSIFGWSFNNSIELTENVYAAFYMNYLLLALLLLILAFALVKRLERSWIGLSMDAVRLDETAAACYGIGIRRWKVFGFTLGNFLIGVAGALYGMMLGFIAPANFSFSESLILVSIVLLGGIGNPWGLAVASAIIILLPEKLQIIQEYRILLFASLVVLILLFRPDGLLPRGLRTYMPGRRAPT